MPWDIEHDGSGLHVRIRPRVHWSRIFEDVRTSRSPAVRRVDAVSDRGGSAEEQLRILRDTSASSGSWSGAGVEARSDGALGEEVRDLPTSLGARAVLPPLDAASAAEPNPLRSWRVDLGR